MRALMPEKGAGLYANKNYIERIDRCGVEINKRKVEEDRGLDINK